MDPLKLAERLAHAFYRWHYQLPEWLARLVFVLAATAVSVEMMRGFGWLTLIPLGLAGGAAVSIVRWWGDKRLPALFAVAEFHSNLEPEAGRDVQADVLTALNDHMKATAFVALPIRCSIGRHQESFASRLLYALDAFHLVHG